MLRMVISPVLPIIEYEFGLSHSTAGLILGAMTMVYGLMQFPSGFLSDILGRRIILSIGAAASGIVALILASSNSVFMFITSIVLIGICTGTYFPVGISLISDNFERNLGIALGIHGGAGSVSRLIAPLLSVFITLKMGWRWTFYILSVPTLALAFLACLKIRRAEFRPKQLQIDLRGHLKVMFSDEIVVRLLLLNILYTNVIYGIISFLPTFLMESKSFSIQSAGLLFAVWSGTGIFMKPITGFIVEKTEKRLILISLLIFSMIFLSIIVFSKYTLIVIASIFVFGASYGAIPTILQKTFMEILPDSSRGTGYGIIRTIYMTISGLAPIFVGYLADVFDFQIAFVLLIMLLLIGCALVFTTKFERD